MFFARYKYSYLLAYLLTYLLTNGVDDYGPPFTEDYYHFHCGMHTFRSV